MGTGIIKRMKKSDKVLNTIEASTFTRDNLKMEREMAKVFSFIQMEVYMKAISVMDKEMVRASIMILSIRVIMKVNGLRER